MITFYPGPSRVHSKLPEYLRDAYFDGILGINHRSPEFEDIYRECVLLLKEKLRIPEDYQVFFTSSATECWEIIAQSLIKRESFHVYNGAFGEKWMEYTRKLKKKTTGHMFSLEEPVRPKSLSVPGKAEVICLTQNETSNGTQVSNEIIRKIKKKHKDKLVAVDATSSLGGVYLALSSADIWYASVQKCFGLPAGLGVMICSPQTLEKARALGENDHYNSLLFIMEKAQHHQTTLTPNVLNIYLLMRVMQNRGDIKGVGKKLTTQYLQWEEFFRDNRSLEFLVENPSVRSHTVLTLKSKADKVKEIKESAKKSGIILGNGYGRHKNDTFRIANFPAIRKKEIKLLRDFFRNNLE